MQYIKEINLEGMNDCVPLTNPILCWFNLLIKWGVKNWKQVAEDWHL